MATIAELTGHSSDVPHSDQSLVYHKYVVRFIIPKDLIYCDWEHIRMVKPALWPWSADSLLQTIIDFASEHRDDHERVSFPGGFQAVPSDVYKAAKSKFFHDEYIIKVVSLDEWFETGGAWPEEGD